MGVKVYRNNLGNHLPKFKDQYHGKLPLIRVGTAAVIKYIIHANNLIEVNLKFT